MKARKGDVFGLDVRAILEKPVGRIAGRTICAFEAGLRRAAEDASRGQMAAAAYFIAMMEKYGRLQRSQLVNDRIGLIVIPKEWDQNAWSAMFDEYGPPPWPGKHDGLVPIERWKDHYGRRPRPLRRTKRSER